MEKEFVTRVKFEAEKRAKNTAYAFILANGLYDDFREFCRMEANGDVDELSLIRAVMGLPPQITPLPR